MSKVLRSDQLKTKKQDTKVLRSDVASNKKVLVKKPIASSTLKTSAQLKDSKTTASEEKEKSKIKITNVTSSTTSNKAKVAVNKIQPPRKTAGNLPTKALASRKVSSISQQKDLPLRAKHLTTTKDTKEISKSYTSPRTSITKIDKKPVNKKPNAVLDTPHNVTVASPPPKRKSSENVETAVSDDKFKTSNNKLTRKGSRTLAPDEIVVLKRESAKKRIEEQIRNENLKTQQPVETVVKEPVAFEVKFEEKEKVTRERSRSRSKTTTTNIIDKNDEEPQYSDDFESYESDFESSSHSQVTSETSSVESEEVSNSTDNESNEIENQEDSLKNLATDESEDEDDDSEVTQNPITVIQRDKERKLDSGHYDMNSRKTIDVKSSDISMQSTQAITDSLEAFSLGLSEQLDSGISTYTTSIVAPYSKANLEVIYGGYKDFNIKPIMNQRGSDLMSKIHFDILSFTLLDLKPISYDIFMQTFGKLNTNQNFTQTQGDLMNVEQQTDLQETRSIWTQHPPQYDFEIITTLDKTGIYNQNCCGELIDECRTHPSPECELEQSLDILKQLNSQSSKRTYQNYQKRQRKPVNYEHLNSFLLRSSLVIDQILGSSNNTTNNKPKPNSLYENDQVLSRISEKCFNIDSNFLNTLHVVKIFSNNKYNLLITVHESLPDTNVYSSDFTNLLMVWCTNTCDKPLRLLTTWSQVSKVEISNDSSDIIVAALRDGSIALWDLRETHSFCSKLDGYLTHFAATQSLVPSWCGIKDKSMLVMDLGACLDVKSFRSHSNNLLAQRTFPKTQFVSLHDSGVVTVWTLVETSEAPINFSQMKKYEKPKISLKMSQAFEFTSPWARVKLMQSTIVNLKDYLETKSHQIQSRFDKTKAFFQKDIYSDEALKELNECNADVGQQGLRFTNLECGSENVFICTNRNYILICSKSLKMDKLQRIVINESRFLFPTALKVLSNEHFIAVGLSNGAVMILNCQSNKIMHNNKSDKISNLTESIPPSRDPMSDINPITGKSCAIQNILLNVQKSYEDMDFNPVYRPDTAACIALIDSKQKPFELRIFDQQIIMNGSVLRKNLIKSLELSSDGWRLFALTNGHIRIYDFYLDQEIDYQESQETGKIIDIATAKCGCKENNLMILKPNTEVEVHILNK
ncbi:cytoplasmic dynein 2 intermediate chain 1 [Lucilia cuprina]|uniref:cytoplasmic dynein 2 intermediate chain 1 n=1 Tax=Lucilia cuprina TaxID=7375 RepID=UPI001F066363|nr:cytoplasmic dynein 2 intermediate chain 1 [Lucilia cuprina]